MLNRTRGGLSRPRAQIDRNNYKRSISNIISNEGVDIIEDEVIDILINSSGNKKTIKVLKQNPGEKLFVVPSYSQQVLFYLGKYLWERILGMRENWRCLLKNLLISLKIIF